MDNGVCTTPNNNLGIHVNVGPSQKEMCNHFICIQCLPHWHENVIGKLHHSLGSSPGSKTQVHCFVPSCDCIVGDPLTLEDTMRSLGCKFIVSAEYSKSPMKRSISTTGAAAKEASKHEELPANSVQIIAHASIDPEWIVAWASEVSDFNFGIHSTLTSVCEGIQLRDPDTEEWTGSIPSTDRTFCTTVVTFADAPLAQKFNDMFNLEAILDPVAGCLTFCGVTLDEFGEIDPSEIIQVNPPPRVAVPTQQYAGSKRMLDLNAGIYGSSAAQNYLGKQEEIKVKREASPWSTSSSTNDIMKERSGYMSLTPPFGDPTTEDSKKRALDEDAELEKKVAKFQPPTIASQQDPALPSSVTGIRNTRNATMQRLLPKIVHQSVADKLYPPQDDNTCYVEGILNDRAPPSDAKNKAPGGVPANAYASTALKLAVLTEFADKILAITVSPNEENASNGGRMIGGQMYPRRLPQSWSSPFRPKTAPRREVRAQDHFHT